MFESSAVWSAYGLATADITRIFQRHRYLRMPVDVSLINETFKELEDEAMDEMKKIGFDPDEIDLRRELSMKFGRQVNVETIPVSRKTYAKSDVDEICESFMEYYRSLYGEGAAFVEAGLEIMSFIVNAVKPAILPPTPKIRLESEDPSQAFKTKRDVFLPDGEEFVPVNTYEFERLRPGNAVNGPAIIEAPTTTMFILRGQIGVVDECKNLRVTEEE